MSNYEIFHAGDVLLQSGKVLLDARVAYRTHGLSTRPATTPLCTPLIIRAPMTAMPGRLAQAWLWIRKNILS